MNSRLGPFHLGDGDDPCSEIDVAGAQVGVDLLKRGSTTVTKIEDNDLLLDAKDASVNLSLLSKRGCGSTTVTDIEDNDLIDAKGASVDLSLFSKRHHGKVTVTNIEDNDLIDGKGASVNVDLLKRGKTTITNIEDNDLLLDAKDASVGVSLLSKRGCDKTTVTNIEDNDLEDAKGFALNVDPLSRRHGSTTVTSIEDNDAVDLKDVAVNVDVLKRRARPCNKGKVTVTNIEDNDGIDAKGASVNVGLLKKKRQDTAPVCPTGTHLVPQGYHCGVLFYEDNDLIDLKDVSINICLLSDGCQAPAPTTPNYLGALGNYVCQDPLGCCVANKGKHHGHTITFIEDNDLIDAKNFNFNLGLL
ncbi:hypothetical protein OC842_007685 [Tilletia horrida]|uniref:Uncharacterized protein n=1 Tax=Tilletia horrida TaxID=155126 RepID=A0AAN6JGN6_9BASI|nr:hypothetical protein OC842_007685 [Tilletia horrida]